MKFKILKTFAIVVCVAGFMMILKSCKKNERVSPSMKESEIMAKVVKNVQSQIDELGGTPEIYIVNQRLPTRFVNMQDQTVNLGQRPNTQARSSACSDDLPDYLDLKQYMKIYQCASSGAGGNGFKIQIEYELSWNNNVALANPNNSNLKTKANMRIYSSTGSVLSTITTYDAVITNLGTDPNNSSNDIFRVKFTSPVISSPYFVDIFTHVATTNTLKFSPYFASDCPTFDKYTVTYEDPAGYGITPGPITSPCNRVDKAWYQSPGSVGASNVIGIAGLSPLGTSSCGYTGNFIKPDLQEAQYKVDDSSWRDFKNIYDSTYGILNSKFIGSWSFAASEPIGSGTHLITIRYKNWKYNRPRPMYPIPSSTFADTSCATYNINNIPSINYDPSYAYEYYPNTVIP